MPYIHMGNNCGGEISFWSRRCKKCKKKWPITALFGAKPPWDMGYVIEPKKERKGATYAKWADKVPGAAYIAQRLPNWPRWKRILAVIIIGAIIALIIKFIWG